MRIALPVVLFLSLCGTAMAEEAKVAPPSCGKTPAECQKQVDALQAQLKLMAQQTQAYRSLAIEANDRLVQQVSGQH